MADIRRLMRLSVKNSSLVSKRQWTYRRFANLIELRYWPLSRYALALRIRRPTDAFIPTASRLLGGNNQFQIDSF